jgi:choline-glycine betaine transporter
MVVFAAKTILFSNLFSTLLNVVMVAVQVHLTLVNNKAGNKQDAEFRLLMSIAFGAMSGALLGQSYMYWHSEEPLNEYLRPGEKTNASFQQGALNNSA